MDSGLRQNDGRELPDDASSCAMDSGLRQNDGFAAQRSFRTRTAQVIRNPSLGSDPGFIGV
jgi:hypothetical protein